MELVIVMMLLVVVLAVAAPSLRSFAHGRTDADAAAGVLAMTRLARSTAATMGTPCRVNIDPEAGLCWVTVQEAGVFVELETDLGKPLQLPDDMIVVIELAPGQEPRNFVQFLPDGRTEQAAISLTDRDGGVWRIQCPSPTDRFRLVKPWEDQQ
jgi:Tfp pilus assembly protein FimT